MNKTKTPALSVVIIGRNEGVRLERCIESVLAMQKPAGPLEIIYVDSGSNDDSVALAEGFGAKVVEVRPDRPTAALGRNAGWRQATAPFVFFLDGDTTLHPHFVVDALKEFEDPAVAVVWGHRRETKTLASVYNRVLDLDWITAPGVTDYCGGDALIRRATLELVGGYDQNLIAGEEPEMCRRIRAQGGTILHVDMPMTGHDLAITTWRQYWRRATRTGYAYAEVSERFRHSSLPFWESETRANRNRALLLPLIPLLGLIASLLLRQGGPSLAALFLLLFLVFRTSWKTKWKSDNFTTRFLYGLHSHLQQIPIFVGQLQYTRDRKTGRSRGLIEYKNQA